MKTAMVSLSFWGKILTAIIFSLIIQVSYGATFTVNTLTDVATGTGVTGSLRYCITTANATPGATAAAPHIINFSVAGTITVGSNLPIFTTPIYVNGSSAPGYAFWVPVIQISGFSITINSAASAGSHFSGLVLSNAAPHAIDINGVNNILIEECFIGTNLTGTAAAASAAHGIIIQNSSASIIKNCVISGNGAMGIMAINSPNLYIIGNHIGCNLLGTAAIANGAFGILLQDNCSTTQIGGFAGGVTDSANVISGNNQVAIGIQGSAKTNIKIIRNTIGLTKAGAGAAGMGNQFAVLDNSSSTNGLAIKNNFIGTTTAQGIYIEASSNVVIQGNYIGTNKAGTVSVPTGENCIDLNGTHGTIIGGAAAGQGNVIGGSSASGRHGIVLQGATRTNNCIIKGNYIGTNASGTAITGGGIKGYGIALKGSNNIIGGTLAGEGNIISGCAEVGVLLTDGSANQIVGNKIGIDISGTALGNGFAGVMVRREDPSFTVQNNIIRNNIIGGTLAGEGNIISGCAEVGVLLTDGSANQIVGNKIGIDISGTALGNGFAGVMVRREDPSFTVQNNIIRNNIIAYNGFTYPSNPVNATWILPNKGPGIGVGVAEYGTSNIDAVQHLISQNAIYCNAGLGISLNKLEPTPGYGNLSKASPVINVASDNVTTFGTAAPGDVVEVFANPNTCGCQGEIYLGSVTADGAGNWTLVHANYNYLKITATAREANNNTSEFTNCIDPTSLPVEYLSFNVFNNNNGTALLKWETIREDGNAYFNLEKSFDGVNFFYIGQVPDGRNFGQINAYSFVDVNLSSSSYYRIKQFDVDGKYTYSIVRYLQLQGESTLSIYPNPATDYISINGSVEKNSEVSLTLRNSLSQVVLEAEWIVTGDFLDKQIDIASLPPGVYLLTVQTEAKSYLLKVIKK
jgi:hypothetical protein